MNYKARFLLKKGRVTFFWLGIAGCLLSQLVYLPVTYALAKPQREVLANGLVLVLLEQHSLPFVVMELSLQAGSVFDPPGKAGLASLTADLLTEGTKSKTALEVSEKIDFVGGALSSSSGIDFSQLNLKILKKDLATGFSLLSDCLTNPVFKQAELERLRKETVAAIVEAKDDPHAVAGKAFKKLVYGTHPYRYPVIGEEETVPLLKREDVVTFYQQYYHPNNAVLIVVGDTSLAEVKQLIGRYWQKWQKQKISFPDIPKVPTKTPKQVELVDKPLSQATILLGHIGIKRTNPDYYAAYVMNYILGGGGFSARLLTEIRDKQGLAYSAASYFAPALYAGSFKGFVQTKNKNASKVVAALLQEMEKIKQYPVTSKELQDAQSFITGSFPLKLDTNSKIAGYLTYIEHYHLGLDYFEKFPHYIDSVTREDVQHAAQKYLHPKEYQLVIVADQEKASLVSP